MLREPKLSITLKTTERAVERVSLTPSFTFSYHIEGPRLNIDTFMEGYLKGELPPLPPLYWGKLTPFTKEVLETLTLIPFGKTVTYGELATLAGYPGFARAVGGALGRNPFPLLLPCHRICARGGMGGFSAGLQIKEILLSYESFI